MSQRGVFDFYWGDDWGKRCGVDKCVEIVDKYGKFDTVMRIRFITANNVVGLIFILDRKRRTVDIKRIEREGQWI
jgi:hypothetical protein